MMIGSLALAAGCGVQTKYDTSADAGSGKRGADGATAGGDQAAANGSGGAVTAGAGSTSANHDGGAGQTGNNGPSAPPSHPPAPPVKLDRPTAPAMAYTGKNGAKLVALTFDDGPDNRYTPAILDILKAQHVHGTFFTVGVQVKRYPAVMKRIVKEGHEIGNHSYSHPDLSKLDCAHVLNQIKWTDTLIDREAGFVPRLVRAPYGAASPLLKQIVADNGRRLINWTVDTRDWDGSTVPAMRANVNKNTHPGGIILMHSFGSKRVGNTVELLPLIIKDLRLKGYAFVTVSELLDAKARSEQAAAKKK
ncbi:polysaccharide deacetylase family protein [Paenibacillus lycopersici]|uniref:Polysaccharide deacetylase family protein n=1 Tax=Paenibacillus lycopersici TaxID=2704462 RepID=A0A6C0FVK5_9BACL|nr:polysaccharide deacetylase family protein [Paenibacillus lycopersici]QHT59324.1 polysaccharide deacetylase family protein [Paenibacillus lycopersici]